MPGAGMTIKFFGLFFLEQCGLSPVAVSLLATVSPFCVSSGSFCAQAASKWCAFAPAVALQHATLPLTRLLHHCDIAVGFCNI